MNDSWYLRSDEYYVLPDEQAEYPPRQGDIFGPIEFNGETWLACQLVHPTCELAKASVAKIQVIRVHRLDEVKDQRQQAALCTGWTEKGGIVQIAFAHTFFLPPVPAIDTHMPLFSNFREAETIDKDSLLKLRLAALTHEARVTFIRRMIYYQHRLYFSSAEVMAWEAKRISSDATFEGPRPAWAQFEPPASE